MLRMNLYKITIPLFLTMFISFNSCKNKPTEPSLIDETLFFFNQDQELNPEVKQKFPDWIKNDMECFSYVKILNDYQKVTAYPIKCKIIGILRSGVKCRVLENTSYFTELSCGKYDVKVGSIWFETEGELFLTKEETVKSIKEKGFYLMETTSN